MKDKPEIAAVVVIVIGIGLIAGLVVNEQRKPKVESQVLGEKFTQSDLPAPVQTGGIPTLPVTIPAQILPGATKIVRPEPTAPATTTSARPATRSTSGTTTRSTGSAALFEIKAVCGSESVSSSGQKLASGKEWRPGKLAAGQKFSYTFTFDAATEKSTAQECAFRTTRVAAGSASPFRIMLRCSGESTYSSTPPSPQTSAISKSWKPEQLTGGFTHRMTAPRQSQQSERTTCAVDVVRV